ncbi:hypothetical protein [Candidatus Magnetobacterium casense]|uniref:Uncharacterized protein n=1 Tax=Candidatus Magnetobacterium casense TaxID=1455061 RepID=A0ABS6RWP3_9BACT|nr:hypothetical protein [Candidatus Magnetobacterium casensis]MBV6341046.1 hypothetical protein [Candidatus Magnetobacterium casensis]
MLRDLRAASTGKLKLSFAIPFWFNTLAIDDKALSFHIIDAADEVAVMSYRTQFDEMVNFACKDLCYASSVNKPLYLGAEITKLPDEQHFVFKKQEVIKFAKADNGKLVLTDPLSGGANFFNNYEVKSEKLTFHKSRANLKDILNRLPAFKSFSGYIIHSYEEMD